MNFILLCFRKSHISAEDLKQSYTTGSIFLMKNFLNLDKNGF